MSGDGGDCAVVETRGLKRRGLVVRYLRRKHLRDQMRISEARQLGQNVSVSLKLQPRCLYEDKRGDSENER